MSDIYIPEKALKDEEEFKRYILKLHAHLFKGASWIELKPDLPKDPVKALELIETIMKIVNFHLNGELKVPPYRERKKKCSTIITDVLVVTNKILQTHYNMRPIQIARFLNFNHSTINYYDNKFDSMCVYKTFKYKFVRIVINLADQNLIPEVKLANKELRAIRDSIQAAKVKL
jgi:hypothetical protein